MTPIIQEIQELYAIKHVGQAKIWNIMVRSIAFRMSKDIMRALIQYKKNKAPKE